MNLIWPATHAQPAKIQFNFILTETGIELMVNDLAPIKRHDHAPCIKKNPACSGTFYIVLSA
jgi:hypothetical protein